MFWANLKMKVQIQLQETTFLRKRLAQTFATLFGRCKSKNRIFDPVYFKVDLTMKLYSFSIKTIY